MPPKHTAPSAHRIGWSAARVEGDKKVGLNSKPYAVHTGSILSTVEDGREKSLSQVNRDFFYVRVVWGLAAGEYVNTSRLCWRRWPALIYKGHWASQPKTNEHRALARNWKCIYIV